MSKKLSRLLNLQKNGLRVIFLQCYFLNYSFHLFSSTFHLEIAILTQNQRFISLNVKARCERAWDRMGAFNIKRIIHYIHAIFQLFYIFFKFQQFRLEKLRQECHSLGGVGSMDGPGPPQYAQKGPLRPMQISICYNIGTRCPRKLRLVLKDSS